MPNSLDSKKECLLSNPIENQLENELKEMRVAVYRRFMIIKKAKQDAEEQKHIKIMNKNCLFKILCHPFYNFQREMNKIEKQYKMNTMRTIQMKTEKIQKKYTI